MLGAPYFMNAGLHVVPEGWLVFAVVYQQQKTFPP